MTEAETRKWAGDMSRAIEEGLRQIERGEEPCPLWLNPKTAARTRKPR